MGAILTRERETYESMWAVDAYATHSPGEAYLKPFLQMSGACGAAGETVLDAGCGTGKGALALKAEGFDVQLCDVTDAGLVDDAKALDFRRVCLWHDLESVRDGYGVEWVYCCDVLEHIPQAFTMLTIQRMLDLGPRGVFLSIALVPDHFGAWIGTPLHQTVQSFVWWRDAISELGTMIECRDYQHTGLYLVAPR